MAPKVDPRYQELHQRIQQQEKKKKKPTGTEIRVKELAAGTSVVNLLGTAGVDKPVGHKGSSWIAYWETVSQTPRTVCCAQGCNRTDSISGGHVKIARGPVAAALLHTAWYIVPTCPDHNRGSSCKTFKVKKVKAVEAPPSTGDRLLSWPADIAKLGRAMVGER